MDYIVHGVAKSRTRLSDFHFTVITKASLEPTRRTYKELEWPFRDISNEGGVCLAFIACVIRHRWDIGWLWEGGMTLGEGSSSIEDSAQRGTQLRTISCNTPSSLGRGRGPWVALNSIHSKDHSWPALQVTLGLAFCLEICSLGARLSHSSSKNFLNDCYIPGTKLYQKNT